MLQADPRESKEPPQHERMQQSRHGPLANHARLQHHLGERAPQAAAKMISGKLRAGPAHRPQPVPHDLQEVPQAGSAQGQENQSHNHQQKFLGKKHRFRCVSPHPTAHCNESLGLLSHGSHGRVFLRLPPRALREQDPANPFGRRPPWNADLAVLGTSWDALWGNSSVLSLGRLWDTVSENPQRIRAGHRSIRGL